MSREQDLDTFLKKEGWLSPEEQVPNKEKEPDKFNLFLKKEGWLSPEEFYTPPTMPMAPPGEPIIMPDVLKPEPREELPPERTLFEEEPVDYSTGSKFIEKAYPFLRGAAEEFTLGMAEFPDEWQPKPGINEALYGAGKFAGFFGPALLYGGKATQIAIKPLLKKLGTRASGQIASRIIGSGVPLGVASAITDIKDIEGMPERFIHGFMFGSILGATSHLNFHKLAPVTNLLIRQFSSRAMANMANIYEPTALKEIVEGSISGEYSPDLPNKVFDELIFTVFSFRKASPKEILDTLDKINPEIERLNLPVETWKVNPDGIIETSTGKIVRINAFGKSVEDAVRPPKKPIPKKNYYRFFPQDAPQAWRDVADATSGKMIRPFKDLQTGKFIEYEEYKHDVPKQLRGKQGYAPDEVAQLLKLEDSEALYRLLEYRKTEPVKDMPEHVQAAENEVLTLEADILKGTKRPEAEVTEFIDNDFMDGERLREITQEVLRGEKAKVDAIKEVGELIEDTVKPPEAEYYKQRAMGFEPVKEPTTPKPTPEKTIRAMVEEKSIKEITELKEGKLPEEIAVLDKILAEKTGKEAKQIRMIPEEELIKGGEGGYVKLGREERLRRIKEKGLYAEELPKEKIEPLPKLTEAELESARKAGKVEELLPSERAKGLTFKEELELEKELPIRMLSEKALTKGDESGYIKIEVQKTFGDSVKTRAYQNIFDRFHSIKKLSDIVKKEGTELPPHKDPYIGIRNYLGVQGKAETKIFYKRFEVDWRGNIHFKGESLKDILKPVKGRVDDFRRYLIDRRVPELEGRGIETGRNLEEAKKFIKENIREFEPHAKKFTEYMHSLLDELHEAGFIDKETLKVIKANNQMYAPFKRVVDDIKQYGYVAASKKVLSKIISPIKGIKGSKRQIIDPIESAIESTYRITEVVERNRIANQIIDLRKISPEIARIVRPIRPGMAVAVLEDGTRVYRPLANQKEGIIEVLTDGDRHYYEVPKDLYDSMAQLDKVGYSWMTKLLAAPARLLRTGATSTPEFAFRNPVRDQWFAFVNSKYGYIPGYDFAKGLFNLIKKPELYWKWKASGGEWSMLVTLDKATTQINIKRLLGARDYKRYLKSPISFFEDVSMMGEIPTRLGVFERAQGKVSDIEAAFQSREGSIDFARRGAKTKVISALYTFLNARMQAMDKLVRTAKERPVETLSKIIAVAVIPSVINYLLNRDDPYYWEIPEWQRDLFWIIPIRRGKGVMGKKPIYLRIPKGDVGVIFGTSTEKILGYMDKDKEGKLELDKLALAIIKESMPISDIGGFLPVAARIPVELMANEKFFYGRPIVSRGQERLEPREQYGPFTSETSKALGKVFNISAFKIDHLITGYGAGLARYALKLNDGILGEMGVLPEKPERPKSLADLPVVRAFAIRDPMGFGSQSVQNFYDALDEIEKFSATEKMLKERGKGGERIKYMKSHKVEFMATRRKLDTEFRRARSDLSALRKIRDRALNSTELTATEKEQVMGELNALVMARIMPLLSKYRALEAISKEKLK